MRTFLFVAITLLFILPAFGQTSPGAGTFGTGLSISGLADVRTANVASVQNALNARYWVTNPIVIFGGLGLSTTSDVGTIFQLSWGAAYHFNKSQLSPELGAAMFINSISPSGGQSQTQFGFILGAVAEYYPSNHFGVEIIEGIQFNSNPTTFAFTSRLGLNWYL